MKYSFKLQSYRNHQAGAVEQTSDEREGRNEGSALEKPQLCIGGSEVKQTVLNTQKNSWTVSL